MSGRRLNDRRPVALAGFMGAGKTTVGARLAELLGRTFHDTDRLVEERTGRSVADFFERGEEAAFRRQEAEVVAQAMGWEDVVVALGGGALLDERSRRLVLERSVLVHLEVPWEDLRPRLAAVSGSRPLLRGRPIEEVRALYLARLSVYRQAPVQLLVAESDPAATAARLAALLERD